MDVFFDLVSYEYKKMFCRKNAVITIILIIMSVLLIAPIYECNS